MREVEFFAQVHPLIHGGRHSELRAPGTRDALIALRDGGIISGDVAADLDAAYVLFRTIEHRLQMVEDQQTHNLPKSAEGLALVAGLHGLDGSEALFDLLRPHVERTATLYDGLIGSETSAPLSQDPGNTGELREAKGITQATTPEA